MTRLYTPLALVIGGVLALVGGYALNGFLVMR